MLPVESASCCTLFKGCFHNLPCRLLYVTSGKLWSYCCCMPVLIMISKDVLLALDQAENYRLDAGGSPQLCSEK